MILILGMWTNPSRNLAASPASDENTSTSHNSPNCRSLSPNGGSMLTNHGSLSPSRMESTDMKRDYRSERPLIIKSRQEDSKSATAVIQHYSCTFYFE